MKPTTRLAELRYQRFGIIQREMAERVGMSRTWYILIERRQRQARPHHREQIARAVGVSVGTLFDVRGWARPARGDGDHP